LKAAALFSGGKDSLFALWTAIHQGYEVSCLITFIPESLESWLFHYPAVRFATLQAEAMGIPILIKRTSDSATKGLRDLRSMLKKAVERFDVDVVVSGVLASDYQRTLVDLVCEELKLRTFTPLWGKRGELLLAEVMNLGFSVMIVSVAAEGLTRKWLGKVLNGKSIKELISLASRYRFNPAGEGGEYETLVLDAPIFRKRIVVKKARPVWMGDSGYLEIEEAYLAMK